MIPLPRFPDDPNIRTLSQLERETRTGSASATWDLTNKIVEGYELIFKNGLLLQVGTDYTVAGKTVTFVGAIVVGDRTTAVYYYPAN